MPVRPSPAAVFEPPVTDKASGWDFEGIRSDDLTPCAAAQTPEKRLVRREWGIGRSMNEVSSDEELSDMPVLERLLGDTFSQEEYSTNAAAIQDHVEEGKECRAAESGLAWGHREKSWWASGEIFVCDASFHSLGGRFCFPR